MIQIFQGLDLGLNWKSLPLFLHQLVQSREVELILVYEQA